MPPIIHFVDTYFYLHLFGNGVQCFTQNRYANYIVLIYFKAACFNDIQRKQRISRKNNDRNCFLLQSYVKN